MWFLQKVLLQIPWSIHTKMRKYAELAERDRAVFSPCVFEVFGRIGPKSIELFRQLCSLKDEAVMEDDTGGSAWHSSNFAAWRNVAQLFSFAVTRAVAFTSYCADGNFKRHAYFSLRQNSNFNDDNDTEEVYREHEDVNRQLAA